MILRSRQKEFLAFWERQLPDLYDFVYQIFRDEETTLKILQRTYHRASFRFSRDSYDKYLQLWLLQIAVKKIQNEYKRFLTEQPEGYRPQFSALSLSERLVLLLSDRLALSTSEIASVMQSRPSRASMTLVYAREKLAQYDGFSEGLRFAARLKTNENLDGFPTHYAQCMRLVRRRVAELPKQPAPLAEYADAETKLMRFIEEVSKIHWSDLSWKYKLALETVGLAVVGLLAIVILPWMSSRINYNAILDGRFADALTVVHEESPEITWQEVTAERLLASADAAEHETKMAAPKDEFANMEFPSDDVEAGAAPLAPSRQNASVYRLILQSPSPTDMASQMRTIFSEEQVKERELSGSVMPGGVYFDGVTTEAAYSKIREAVVKLGSTATYANQYQKRRPDERARVIVWIQQI
jgi:DNA-directed RNA polymerase specialized sigma24 family protein